jgi:hypothetical protein
MQPHRRDRQAAGVIAVELRQQAIHLEKSAARTLESLNALSVAAAASDPKTSAEGGGEAGHGG